MELEKLRIFVAVARSGSFSLGARQLYISHSTTSRAIAALEEELGVRLVERGNRVLGLTAAGTVLLREAEELLKRAAEAADRVREAGTREKNGDIQTV